MFKSLRTRLFLNFEYLIVYQILWRWGPGNDEDWLNEIYNILDMNFMSTKNMKWKFGKSYKLFYFQVREHPSTFRLPPLHPTRFSDGKAYDRNICRFPYHASWKILIVNGRGKWFVRQSSIIFGACLFHFDANINGENRTDERNLKTQEPSCRTFDSLPQTEIPFVHNWNGQSSSPCEILVWISTFWRECRYKSFIHLESTWCYLHVISLTPSRVGDPRNAKTWRLRLGSAGNIKTVKNKKTWMCMIV